MKNICVKFNDQIRFKNNKEEEQIFIEENEIIIEVFCFKILEKTI